MQTPSFLVIHPWKSTAGTFFFEKKNHLPSKPPIFGFKMLIFREECHRVENFPPINPSWIHTNNVRCGEIMCEKYIPRMAKKTLPVHHQTVDGSEIPRPTTILMYKTLKNKRINCQTSTGEWLPDFWLPSTVVSKIREGQYLGFLLLMAFVSLPTPPPETYPPQK